MNITRILYKTDKNTEWKEGYAIRNRNNEVKTVIDNNYEAVINVYKIAKITDYKRIFSIYLPTI